MPGQKKKSPESVIIVAMGRSASTYLSLASSRGNFKRTADEVWAINAMAGVIQHDRAFIMDDVETILAPMAERDPKCMSAGLFDWLEDHPGPIYTSTPNPKYPALVEYPLEDVINSVGHFYLNTTVAYAVAYAMHLGVKEVGLYGADFTYPDHHAAEQGRGCVEFLLGIAGSRGIRISIASDSTLMDACVPEDRKFYGYRDLIEIAPREDGKPGVMVKRKPRHRNDAPILARIGPEPAHNGEAREAKTQAAGGEAKTQAEQTQHS